ncbi:MAG: DnaJ domain-containing protein [Gammaproteobacteria bacterium]|jgi:DnaJ like chaperone protein|nr:DnaJ domain-containing protein [Gammaproteobacteria bacterium]
MLRFRHRAYRRALLQRLSGEQPAAPLPNGGSTEAAFTRALLQVLGRLAKLDGRVNESEIAFAERVISQLGLRLVDHEREGSRLLAIADFERGKDSLFDVVGSVRQLAKAIGAASLLGRLVLKTFCEAAYLKSSYSWRDEQVGGLRLKDRQFLREVAEALGFDKAAMLEVCAEVRGTQDWSAALRGSAAYTRAPRREARPSPSLASAYDLLGVDLGASPDELRRAYHRQMALHHPDKLVSKQPSPDELRLAHLKVHAIREAFESLRRQHKALA